MNRSPQMGILVATTLVVAACGGPVASSGHTPVSGRYGWATPAATEGAVGAGPGVGGASPTPASTAGTVDVASPVAGGPPSPTASPSAGRPVPTGSAPPSPSTGGCPAPASCPDYAFLNDVNGTPARWATDSSGRLTLHYRVNPDGSGSTLSAQQIRDAVDAAAATWMTADPQVELVDDGLTSALPSPNSDVVGFGGSYGAGQADVTPPDAQGHYEAFAISFEQATWQWQPCRPAAGQPCTVYRATSGLQGPDLQNVATHEWGHVLGLGHVTDAQRDSELTMYSPLPPECGGSDAGCRSKDTLGIGDVLGVRYLYPTGAPLPVIYSP